MTDAEVALNFEVFSHLDVSDCAWRDVNSYRCELLHLEASFEASQNNIGYVTIFPFTMAVHSGPLISKIQP